MIIVRTILYSLPVKQKEVLQTLLSMVEPPTNGNGLLNYGIYQDIEDETVFKLISEWKTREDVNNHLCSDQFGVLLGSRILLRKAIEVQICTVSRVEGMEVVRSVRKHKNVNPKTVQ
ncbi:antibiotic biosynthesis monooxygenase family protein [Desulfogranum marinum]|uniref:antibiotic biosynthesis monooxygenase family protein n=1 Tax=Desulfogranum marinum TaxID=453220 RepID=UPI0019631734|nr:antibiotic biosynthesis monooxygenase family protein [Desulfogranum marinum]MBM9511911.1 antibiotic biosynthesis monooxygenase [Desulfogranum marinum]